MDPRVRSNNDGTLYPSGLAGTFRSEAKVAPLLYYVALLVFLVFILGSLAVTD
jgi:uncharacterized membrane protein YtjA (UPF0391 family)